jgi:hypothetical protein
MGQHRSQRATRTATKLRNAFRIRPYACLPDNARSPPLIPPLQRALAMVSPLHAPRAPSFLQAGKLSEVRRFGNKTTKPFNGETSGSAQMASISPRNRPVNGGIPPLHCACAHRCEQRGLAVCDTTRRAPLLNAAHADSRGWCRALEKLQGRKGRRGAVGQPAKPPHCARARNGRAPASTAR